MNVRKRSKDDGFCSINFLKYVLFIFNFVFFVVGCGVLAVGIWTVVSKHEFVSLLSTITYSSIAYLLIASGVIVLVVSIIGCVGIWREDKRALLLYTFMLLLIFLMEAVAGIMAYVYEEQVRTELEANLNATFMNGYMFDSEQTRDIDSLQRKYSCCGALDSDDWIYSRWLKGNTQAVNKVPDSCCKTESQLCGKSSHPNNVHNTSCLGKLEKYIKEHLVILGSVGLGVCLVQVFGMILSCCLYIKLRDYEMYYY